MMPPEARSQMEGKGRTNTTEKAGPGGTERATEKVGPGGTEKAGKDTKK
jgi:hypothetical protein